MHRTTPPQHAFGTSSVSRPGAAPPVRLAAARATRSPHRHRAV